MEELQQTFDALARAYADLVDQLLEIDMEMLTMEQEMKAVSAEIEKFNEQEQA